MLTQRAHGRLALIRVALGEGELIISAPGMPDLRTPLTVTALERPALIETRVWRDTMSAFDTGPQAEAWFSQFLGVPARL
ncbi:MOSC N-terminal beta barrel domain-containing protein, partial [Salmonella sp. 1202_ZJSL19Sal_0414]|uniref:MOSC N-terminal beta barrel domain-containing protein n=1 Tax=Salmonella sp. 1202_ZJSL19Sal_0414 TaxID=3159626 RepID=UPI00397E77A2